MKLLKKIKTFFEFEKKAWFNSGLYKIQKRDFKGAVSDFNEVIRIAPSYEAYQNRAAAYSQLSQYEAAIQDLQRAIQLNPKLPEAHLGLGVINTRMGHFKQALDCYDQVINLAPGHTIAYTNRGFVKFKLLDYSGAIADFNEAIDLNDKNAMAYTNRGSVYFKMGQTQEAFADWERGKNLGYPEAEMMLANHPRR